MIIEDGYNQIDGICLDFLKLISNFVTQVPPSLSFWYILKRLNNKGE